jgi:prepilin-type N-terminal cleavage/methylation domain-containing protein
MKEIRNKQKGFTLIELLIVIGIISILSSIVLIATNNATSKARKAQAQGKMRKFTDTVQVATGDSGRTLGNITPTNSLGTRNWTGQTCVSYTSGPVRDLRNSTGSCYNDWVAAINAIALAASSSVQIKASDYYRDPWGSPYYLDENENTTFNCRVYDALVSPGPDGILNDPVNPSYPTTTDDMPFLIVPSYTGC